MAFFIKSLNTQLYVAPTTSEDRGFAAFLLPQPPSVPQEGYDVSQALTDSSLNGSFILSAYTPQLDTQEQTDAFVAQLLQLLGTGRYIIWLSDVNNFSVSQNTTIMTIAGNGSATIQGLTFQLVSGLSLQVQNNMQLTATDNSIVLGTTDSGGARIQFTGARAPDQNISNATIGVLPLSGTYRGCISFSLAITRSSLGNGLSWGFQVLIPLLNNPVQTALSEYLPLASDIDPSPDDAIGFNITIDPTDIFNTAFDYTYAPGVTMQEQYDSRRTVFDFTGKDQDQAETVLTSCYFTTFGAAIGFVPSVSGTGLNSRLIFNNGEQYSANAQNSHLAPEGDFVIQIPNAGTDTVYTLQCGLQGTELFNVKSKTTSTAGDFLRFIGNQPAYAPAYPLPVSSPVTAPVMPNTPLLDTTYRTSWCTVVNGTGNSLPSYLAQPQGAALYGNDAGSNSTLLGHSKPNFTFTPDDKTLFPMLPYSAVKPDATGTSSFSLDQIEGVEKTIISAIRKKNINAVLIAAQQQAKEAFYKRASQKGLKATAAAVPTTVTTPSGLIVGLQGSDNNPVWDAIYLAQNQDSGGAYTKMYFAQPDNELVQAFQTSDLFLVIANGENLGTPVNKTERADGVSEDAGKFYNYMFIGDWGMQANTGTQNKYNDYNNIIIVKGRKGKLYDPDDVQNSLVANWQKWTDKDTFAAPTTINSQGGLDAPDTSQLVILSQWMQTYFSDAYQQTDTAYFGNFNAIATDENWTGILVLGMNIDQLPTNLYGILSGVRYPADFRAHHFGINITPVQQGSNGPEIQTPSSMFGLIYYNDPDFVVQQNPQPIEPDLSETYDFVLLNLQVLFENTSVKKFQSYAQLTTNNYFGSPVDHMGTGGNTYNTMILKGALQFKGSEAIYSLNTDGVNTFYFNNPVVNKVEVTNATFSTIGTDSDGNLVSWFAINGYWDFKKLYMVSKVDGTGTDDDTCCPTKDGGCSCTGTAQCTCTDFDLFSFGNDAGKDDPRKGLIFNGLGIKMVAAPYTPGQTAPVSKSLVFDTSKMTFDQGRSTPRANSLYINFALDLQNLTQGTGDNLPIGKDYLTVITDLKVTSIAGKSWVGLSYQLNMGTPGQLAGNVGLTSTLLTVWDPSANANDTCAAPPVMVGIKLPGTGGGAKLISLQSVLKLSIGQIRLTYTASKQGKYSFMMMFTEIALKFLGLLKIPPNGSSLFYLFGNPQSGGKASGLGWYAMYNVEKQAEQDKESQSIDS